MNYLLNSVTINKGNVKGMTSMNHIHPCFKTKEVLQYIAGLIIDYNYKSINDLSDTEKGEFAALLIEASGRLGEAECIVESPHFDQTINYLKTALKADTKENNEKFLMTIKDNAINYYENTMEAIFEYVLADYQQECREWLNHVAKYGDPDTAHDRYLEQLA